MEALTEALRLATILYLLLLAVTAVADMHQPLLSYPFRAVYSSLRVVVGTVTLGRVELVPMGKRLKRRGVRRIRDLRYELQEWRMERAERNGKIEGGWSAANSPTTAAWSARSDEPATAAAPYANDAPAPYVESVPEAEPAPAPSEEQNAFFYDDGVGDDVIGMSKPEASSTPPKSTIADLWDEDEDDDPLLLDE